LHLQRAVDVRRRSTPKHPDLAVVLLNLGRLRLANGEPEIAGSLLDEAREIAEAALGPDHDLVAQIRGARASAPE
jgi:hypothetical protein